MHAEDLLSYSFIFPATSIDSKAPIIASLSFESDTDAR
jgi:hypothetical protein